MNLHDKTVLRDLAKQYSEICAQSVQDERRSLWRRHNSLKDKRPLIYVRAFAWKEMPQAACLCEDPFARRYEDFFRYQLPILKHFGLVAYGCCEDLTNKIDMLRRILNLRRIAVSPFADVARCAQQIGTDYVISYRPSPADMVSYGFDETRIRSILKRDLESCRGLHVDITLKDVETVQHDPDRVRNWVALTRKVIEAV